MKGRLLVVLAGLLLVAAACVTINVYFPEAAVKDVSRQIEQEVAKQAAQKSGNAPAPPAPVNPPPQPQPKPGGAPSAGLFDGLFVGVAYAADNVPNPEVSSPAIRRIIDSRAARVADIEKYKGMGAIGESNKGTLEVRSLDAVSDLKARADVQRLVRAENADREELYKEIAKAKGIDMSQLDKIRETYAGTLRDNAKPGEWIQMPDGNWRKK